MTTKIFLIKKPLVTEKATALDEAGKYVFIIDKHSSKNEIAKAVKNLYKVTVSKVNIINTAEKKKRYRNIVGFKTGVKKAIVTLKAGQKINLTP